MEYNDSLKAIERFLTNMEALPHTLSPQVQEASAEICESLRIGRLEVIFYDTPAQEAADDGRSMFLYSSGICDESHFVSFRKTTGIDNVVVYKVYRRRDSGDWTEEEAESIRVLVTVLFVYNGRSRLLDQVEHLTYFDQDMDIHNLKYFLRYCGKIIAQGNIYSYAALYFNLKKFSAVNQQLGRETGTMVMRRFIGVIGSLLAPDELLSRIGGDNFALLIRQENLDVILAALRGTPVVYDDRTGETTLISATVGIYVMKDTIPVNAPTDIMDRISVAESIAKERTRHDFACFDEKMMENNQRSVNIAAQFDKALENEEFLVYYQPKISMDTCEIAGAEALCRWKRNGKLISPAEFIPVLEKGMDICRLDFYMLDHVCHDIRRWLDSGKKAVKVSVNLSRRHLTDINLLSHIVSIIDSNNVPHELIEIELTETTTDVEFKDLKRVIGGLQATGISTSVDDFGVGYSSLTLIKDIPWNVLKVDKSFLPLEGEEYDMKKKVMLKHVVAMAQEMGLECVAEGVETREQVELLKSHCCNIAQGYYFDKPLPIEEFENRLDNHRYDMR